MRMRSVMAASAVLLTAVAVGSTVARSQAPELVMPSMEYKTGPFAPSGIPTGTGYVDYLTLINERDGGIEGTRIHIVPCETGYQNQQGVECYEKTKAVGSGALVYQPYSTGITYAIIPKAPVDQIPIFSGGYGRTSAADGTVFPWVFNFPATYWSQASAIVNYIAEREGGHNKLKGKKITLVYHNSAYGKEPIPTLEALAAKHGFIYKGLAVDSPGQEQKATWLQVRNDRPDWVLIWGWGVMNQVAIKEAVGIRFKMDHLIGNWWSASEADVVPSGKSAKGYIGATWHGVGGGYPLHNEIRKHVYDKGKAVDPSFRPRIGEALYNRGMLHALYEVEAIRKAMAIHKTKTPNGKQVRDGLEALEITAARLKQLGLEGFTYPFKITCANHEGPGLVGFMQWDGDKWVSLPKFYEPDRPLVQGLIKKDSAAYAAENKITPRTCN